MLGRRAAKLFAHVRDALQSAGLSSAMGTDYTSVLRGNLLAAPSYCAATPRDTFQGLLCSHAFQACDLHARLVNDG